MWLSTLHSNLSYLPPKSRNLGIYPTSQMHLQAPQRLTMRCLDLPKMHQAHSNMCSQCMQGWQLTWFQAWAASMAAPRAAWVRAARARLAADTALSSATRAALPACAGSHCFFSSITHNRIGLSMMTFRRTIYTCCAVNHN